VNMVTPIFATGPARFAGRALSDEGVNAGDVVETGIRLGGIAVTRGQRGVGKGDLIKALQSSATLRGVRGPLGGFAETNPTLAGRL